MSAAQHAKLLNILGKFSIGKMYGDSIWNVFSALLGVVEKLMLGCNKYLGGIPHEHVWDTGERNNKNKRERVRDLFLNPMPTFFVFLHSLSELSTSLFRIYEFRRLMVVYSRVALIHWVMFVRYCSCNILELPESLSGSWNKWSIITDLVFHIALIINSLQLRYRQATLPFNLNWNSLLVRY